MARPIDDNRDNAARWRDRRKRFLRSPFMPRYWIKRGFKALGQDLQRYRPELHDTQRVLRYLRDRNIATVFDVGANKGQFAQRLRAGGYRGRIVSFEPLPDAHAVLVETARADADWQVAERCALGAARGEAEIHISGNSIGSSLLPMLDRHARMFPGSVYIGTARTPVATLDEFWARYADPSKGRVALKIDTQGFEREVLAGGRQSLPGIELVHFEASLVPLYDGEPTFTAICQILEAAGFHALSIDPFLIDKLNWEVVQADFTFGR
jgi:FkbM family methyltransferase